MGLYLNVQGRVEHSALKTPAIGNKELHCSFTSVSKREQDTRLSWFPGFVHKEGGMGALKMTTCATVSSPLLPSFP